MVQLPSLLIAGTLSVKHPALFQARLQYRPGLLPGFSGNSIFPHPARARIDAGQIGRSGATAWSHRRAPDVQAVVGCPVLQCRSGVESLPQTGSQDSLGDRFAEDFRPFGQLLIRQGGVARNEQAFQPWLGRSP
jgi:hypothetical protein